MCRLRYFLLLLLGMGFSCDSGRENESIRPEVRDITESVYASVRIIPRERYAPQPTRAGVIEAVLVEEGDTVRAGEVLLQLAVPTEVSNRKRDAIIDLQEAKAQLSGDNSVLLDLALELKTGREQLAQDSLNYQRQQKLWSQNIGKQSDLEQYQLAFDASRDRYQQLENQYAQTERELNHQYKKALNRVHTERSALADFTLRAATDGIVYTVYKNTGDRISTQEPFAEIGSIRDFVAELDIDEADITKVAIGDTVLIQLEAYAGRLFKAQVSRIHPQKVQTTQTFRVESTFWEEPPQLYDGLSGEANIMVDRRARALLIPADYLLPGNKVRTRQGEQAVQVGVKNMDFVEILSGIDSTTVILKSEIE